MNKIFFRIFTTIFPFLIFSNATPKFEMGKSYVNTANILTTEVNCPEDTLHIGILNDSPEEIRYAIENGANIHRGKNGKPPILYAVLLKKSNAVQELLTLGADANFCYAGLTLVQQAVKLGDINSGIFLIRNGGKFFSVNSNNRSVMDYALDFVEYPPFPYSVEDALLLVEELILHGYNINSSKLENNIWFSVITHPGRTEEAVKLILKYGANPNQIIVDGNVTWTPLLRCCWYNNELTAKILLEAGANINQKANPLPHKGGPYSPLTYSLSFQPQMVEFFMYNGVDL